MKINGIELHDAGYVRKEESYPVAETSRVGEGKKERCYATIYSNDNEMPLDISGVKSGDKLMLVCLVNVKEYSSVDNKGKKNEPSERFTFEILKCGCEKATDKNPDEMDIDEINEALDEKKKDK